MLDSISKPKLPQGFSYVLKTSQLVNILSAADIDCHVNLQYWMPQGGGSILEAHYWLPNQNIRFPRVYVRAGVVPSRLRSAAAEYLMESALPSFVAWLQAILALPADSPALYDRPYFNAEYAEDRYRSRIFPIYE